MPICPIALEPCARPACRAGGCLRAHAPALVVCWECGDLLAEGVAHGRCIACVRAVFADPAPQGE
jgi:hypothetical protein